MTEGESNITYLPQNRVVPLVPYVSVARLETYLKYNNLCRNHKKIIK